MLGWGPFGQLGERRLEVQPSGDLTRSGQPDPPHATSADGIPSPLSPPGQLPQRVGVAMIGSLPVQGLGSGGIPGSLPQPGQLPKRIGVAAVGGAHRKCFRPDGIHRCLPQFAQRPQRIGIAAVSGQPVQDPGGGGIPGPLLQPGQVPERVSVAPVGGLTVQPDRVLVAASLYGLVGEGAQQAGVGDGGGEGRPQTVGRVYAGAFGTADLFQVVGQPVVRPGVGRVPAWPVADSDEWPAGAFTGAGSIG